MMRDGGARGGRIRRAGIRARAKGGKPVVIGEAEGNPRPPRRSSEGLPYDIGHHRAEAPTAPPALSRRRTNLVFVTIVLGMLLAALDQTIVSTALPTIVADLGGGGHMAWVVTAYLLAETVATVLVGKFGDLFGRKIVFQLSAVVFVGGSVPAGLAGSWSRT